jgi:hypothetical protein
MATHQDLHEDNVHYSDYISAFTSKGNGGCSSDSGIPARDERFTIG